MCCWRPRCARTDGDAAQRGAGAVPDVDLLVLALLVLVRMVVRLNVVLALSQTLIVFFVALLEVCVALLVLVRMVMRLNVALLLP